MKKVSLVILDGFGLSSKKENNSIHLANTPNFDKLFDSGRFAKLDASGKAVGVLDGQIGNSEVGHMTIGSGRVMRQSIAEIDDLFAENSFKDLDVFNDGISYVYKYGSRLHVMGLLGPGGVHAHSNHIKNMIKLIPSDIDVYLHIFGDGRDTDYKSLYTYLSTCTGFLNNHKNVKIASVCGRFYAMDRDNNWDRIEKVYDTIVRGNNLTSISLLDYVKKSYELGIYDEFIEPALFNDNANISSNDIVFFMNFRSDRARQITQAITDDDFPSVFPLNKLENLYFVTMTKYYENYKGKVFIEKKDIKNTLPEIFSKMGLRQLHLAETEKFAHVTKFFAGGNNVVFSGQDNVLIPSPKVKTYDLKPEMSAFEIFETYKNKALGYDFTVVNFANGDMVGHSGKLDASIKAVEILDKIIGELIEFSKKNDIELIITADHGNCEDMGTTENPHTAHTLNLVPFFYISAGELVELKKTGGLSDIAPTVLDIMGIEKYEEMSGDSLIKK
ncbi:MAG: 2,3-bisphosphoglycerate-independent phosphoglycerate mutase [Candidatus Gracilibacteria bacterium]|nr:2,3-bisphosphoglycerate-independent phosphoglycerate mutase [Candidatus Gracilibacteria bacterium]